MTAPVYRAVEAQSREVSMASAFALMTADRDALVEKVQEALAERDNLINAIPDTAPLRDFLGAALMARDDAERECEGWRERAERAEARLEELEGEA